MSFMTTQSPTWKGRSAKIVTPPSRFRMVSCAASATARPPSPSPASSEVTFTPRLPSTNTPPIRTATPFRAVFTIGTSWSSKRLSVASARRSSTSVSTSTPRKPSTTIAPAPNRLATWFTTFSTLASKSSVGNPRRTVIAATRASSERPSRLRSRFQNSRSSAATRAPT